MVIDNKEKFDTDKDELVWTKIISIYPLTKNSKSTHLVKYYKTDLDEEYYIFKYIMSNNGNIADNFDELDWSEIIEQIDFSDNCSIYSQLGYHKNCFRLVSSGKIIKKDIQEYIRIYELEHHQ
ncbi:MAG TPA: hypothetical protein VIM70_09945 [Clostridium sp.]|uniref:hypothetical protein n=1 Tax=Clostridium sp. TaxID=1506 RepID=UPI002F93BFD1